MNSFEQRAKAFEKKFEHDQELLFRILSRRARLIGEWAAHHLGLSGEQVKTYVSQIIEVYLKESGYLHIIAHLRSDFTTYGLDISEHRIEKELERLLSIATEQIQNE